MLSAAMLGWFLWNGMRVLAGLGLVVLGGSLFLLIWFMFEVGLAWVAFVAIGLVLLLASLVLRAVARQAWSRREPEALDSDS
jgi:energy-converting hydrogenase Eha subunit E